MAESKKEHKFFIKTRQLMRNPLLNRKQMIIDLAHPGSAGVSRASVRERLAKMLKAKDEKSIIVYGIRTHFGGGRSTGFANVYDSVEDCKKVEQNYKLVRNGVVEKKEKKGRKGIKEAKNKGKKIFGTVKKHNVCFYLFIFIFIENLLIYNILIGKKSKKTKERLNLIYIYCVVGLELVLYYHLIFFIFHKLIYNIFVSIVPKIYNSIRMNK